MDIPETRVTRRMRRCILAGFVCLFFGLAPLLILYTAGYTYHWAEGRFAKVGVLSIEARPSDASVFVNGAPIDSALPLRLANRKPGYYNVEIKKTGYHPWRDDILVESNRTAYIKDIKLLRIDEPNEWLSRPGANVKNIHPSPDGRFILFTEDVTTTINILLFDADSDHVVQIEEALPGQAITVSWSPYRDEALLAISSSTQTALMLVSARQPKPMPARVLLNGSSDPMISWSQTTDGAFAQLDGVAQKITANGSHAIGEIPPGVNWHVSENEALWFLDARQKRIYNERPDTIPMTYSGPNDVQSIRERTEQRLLLDTAHGIAMYRFDEAVLGWEMVQELPTFSLLYIKKTRQWLAWSPWELWLIDEGANATLVSRSSEYTTHVFPLADNGLLLIATDHSLTALDPRYYTKQTLWSGGRIEQMAVNRKNRVIHFLGTVDGKRGWWQMSF